MEEKRKIFVSLYFPSVFILTIWLVEFIQLETGFNLTAYGLFPRSLTGLRGIFFSPFIHGDFSHLINNSIPLFIMGSSLFYFYRKVAFRVVLMIILLGGFWTWIAARPSFHIGASGLVYGLFGFLVISGFIRRNKALMSISFLVAFVYGSMVWGILPIDYKISWEGHLWGLIAGMSLAIYYRKEGPQAKVYEWEDDDEEADELQEEGQKLENADAGYQHLNIHYHLRKTKDDSSNGLR